MSLLLINRFEKKSVKDLRKVTVEFKNKTGMLIKDHTSDEIIGFIQLENDIKKNGELADRIINTIEMYILEKENADSVTDSVGESNES